MTDKKNPRAVQIGQRIKQARKMAGYNTAAQLLEKIPEWGTGRLGNYEAGISLPAPDDVERIAGVTGSSPCWIMFGLGPIRPAGRDHQAIRHQNLCALAHQAEEQRGGLGKMLKAAGLSRHKLDEHLDNPFLTIADRMARKLEAHFSHGKGWMDQQHVESDPVCAAFPEGMRRLMEIYSNLGDGEQDMLLEMAEAVAKKSGA